MEFKDWNLKLKKSTFVFQYYFMNSAQFYGILQKRFPFPPTYKQDIFFQKIAIFLTEPQNDTIFVLKGYAGTGKTTVISTIVNNLGDINKKYVLLAPTGHSGKSNCQLFE